MMGGFGSGRVRSGGGGPVRSERGGLSRTNVRTRRKETYEQLNSGPFLMRWTAPAPGIEVP
jgi:hypothetical protein